MTLRQALAVTSTESPLISMPAAVNSTCGTPNRAATSSKAAKVASWSVTSSRRP